MDHYISDFEVQMKRGQFNSRVALSRHTKINSKPFNKRSQEFEMLSKINK